MTTTNNGVMPQIQILNIAARDKSCPNIKISSTSINLPAEVMERMGLLTGDYLIIGSVLSTLFIAKKPRGLFAGHRIKSKTKKGGSVTYSVGVQAPKQYNVPRGQFRLGRDVMQAVDGENGQKIEVRFFELMPI